MDWSGILNLVSAIVTVALAYVLFKMIFKLDESYRVRRKVRKNRRRQYLGM